MVDAPRRYPLADLAEAMRESYNQACERLGIGGAERNRIDADGGLSLDRAERIALKAGLHPWNVWPEMVDHLMEDEGAVRTCTVCGDTFRPRSHNQLCCADEACRAERRRRREREPERSATSVCLLPECSNAIEQKPTGRTRLYCCDRHQEAAERARARERAGQAA